MSRLRTRVVLAIAVTAMLTSMTAAPVAAVTIRWAWVVARNPTTATYTPVAIDQGNSAGATNTVTREGAGMYTVTMAEMDGGGGGTFHVSPLAAQARSCSVKGWRFDPGMVRAQIRCFDVNGSRADSRFVAAFQDTNALEGRSAYVWADDELSIFEYEPDLGYSHNSKGASNRALRTHVGRYVVLFGQLASSRGSVQVSRYDDRPIACRAEAWFDYPRRHGRERPRETVVVRCRDAFGGLVNSQFTVTFMQEQGLKGLFGERSAYLWANRPTAASYQPPARYRWSSAGTIPTVTRASVGVYTVELPGMPRGGAALVTPTGAGVPRCIVGSIRTDAAPQRVVVRCFNLAGGPADNAFTLAYLK